MQWVLKKANAPSTQVDSLDTLAQHKSAKVAVLGFFKELEGQAHEAFEKGEPRLGCALGQALVKLLAMI